VPVSYAAFRFVQIFLSSATVAGMFFGSTMVMVTIALVMAVIVTNIYAKKESPERAPDWCIAVVSRFYPAYFLPQRPGTDQPTETAGSGSKNAKRKRNLLSRGWK